MVKTASTQMLPLGASAPEFVLPDTKERLVSLEEFAGQPLLVAFICNHCPFVKHIRGGFIAFGRDLQKQGLAIVAINSNDVAAHPDDAPARMKEEGYPFSYLYDESQAVARAYKAACTPDFFLFDGEHRLAYRGQFDGSRPGNDVPVNGEDLRAAAAAVLANRPVPGEQRPSIGCNIKWKKGLEPEWFSG